MMKRKSVFTMLALPLFVAATATASFAQGGAKPAAHGATQEAKDTAKKSGNALTDGWITMKVHSQFIPEDTLENSDIDVDTKNGVVTLNGTVASAAGKTRAVAIAKATDGVTSVTDNLKIAAADKSAAARDTAKGTTGTTGKPVTDGWIKSKIAAQYVTEDSLDNSDIDIDVTRGAVVLKGAVRTPAARERAAAIAKATDGVKGVTNNLKVSATVK
jgi:hyperosmotically inducible periplasmic protein